MKYFALTDKGYKRKDNQDSYCIIHNTKEDVLMMVCDGVGGAKAGDIASNILVKHMSERFSVNKGFKSEYEVNNYLKTELKEASNQVFSEAAINSDYKGMGTTATGIIISSLGIFVFNVGDSRVYMINKNYDLSQLTSDHTLVNKLIAEGSASKQEAQKHPQASYLTNVCGMWANIKSDVFKLKEKTKYILICSDGLHGYVSDEEIKEIIKNNRSVQQKTKSLMKAALDSGGFDNITIILCKVDDYYG